MSNIIPFDGKENNAMPNTTIILDDAHILAYLAEIEQYIFYNQNHFCEDLGMTPQIYSQMHQDLKDAMRVMHNYGIKPAE